MPLKVVALISGGKDSMFSILHCLANGHEVVALANLHPPDASVEDLDSQMYQTVGHTLLDLYHKAIAIPLYRSDTHGIALAKDKTYQAGESSVIGHAGDETESLVPLLRKIKEAHPEVNALSSGAILSNYQRTRVEHVALRLGLTPLAFLWQYLCLYPYNPNMLLKQMRWVGIDARIIKVASGGLDDTFLWRNVSYLDHVQSIHKAVHQYGDAGVGATLGEGGEYETFVIDGPPEIFRRQLIINFERVKTLHFQGGSACLAFSHLDHDDAWTVPKSEEAMNSATRMEAIEVSVMDPVSTKIIKEWNDYSTPSPGLQSHTSIAVLTNPEVEWQLASPSTEKLFDFPSTFVRCNMHGLAGQSLELQVQTILSTIKDWMDLNSLTIGNFLFCTILLRRMSDFQEVNAQYATFFNRPNPPARVTISCGNRMAQGIDVLLSATMTTYPTKYIDALHVQSRSYWAPANIGPYSQATSVPIVYPEETEASAKRSLIYLSGQIPLHPASMEIFDESPLSPANEFRNQAVLAFQHLERVAKAVQSTRFLSVVAFITEIDDLVEQARICGKVWRLRQSVKKADEPEEDIDPWDMQNLQKTFHPSSDYWLKDEEKIEFNSAAHLPKVSPLIAVVDGLPRGASVEWTAIGYSQKDDLEIGFQIGETTDPLTAWSLKEGKMAFVTSLITLDSNKSSQNYLEQLQDALIAGKSKIGPRAESFPTVYVDITFLDIVQLLENVKCQAIPCKAVFSPLGVRLAAGIVQRLEVIQPDDEIDR